LADRDHRAEDETDDQHREDHVLAVGDRVEQHHGATLTKWRSSARSTSAGAGSPPSERAASTPASPSPGPPLPRNAAQLEISSAIAATAATPQTSAMRTRPCAYR